MKRISTIIIILILSVPMLIAQESKMKQRTEIQNSIIKELNMSYVDSLPIDRLMRARIDAMLAELDPYTVYVPEEENEDMRMFMTKTYGGIGAVITKKREGKGT